MNNPLGVSPSKGKQEPHEVKKKSFDLGGNRTHDLGDGQNLVFNEVWSVGRYHRLNKLGVVCFSKFQRNLERIFISAVVGLRDTKY